MSEKPLVVYILSHVEKALAFEWIARELPQKGINLYFILLGRVEDSPLMEYLRMNKIRYTSLQLNSKKDYPRVFFQILSTLKKLSPRVVHTHLFEANLLGLLAAKTLWIRHRYYTRHHSTYQSIYYPKMNKYHKMINKMSTKVIAISDNVVDALMEEGVSSKKIIKIPHGFDLKSFEDRDIRKVSELSRMYNPQDRRPVIACISRYLELKGIQYIIPAFKQLLKDYPNAYLLLFNAAGSYSEEVKELLKEINEESYREVRFEKDLINLYGIFDVFIHVPIDPSIEAFGQTYIEALAAGVPSVFTLSGIANEVIEHEKNALVVDYKNPNQVYVAIKSILENEELKQKLIVNGRESIDYYNLERFIEQLRVLYADSE